MAFRTALYARFLCDALLKNSVTIDTVVAAAVHCSYEYIDDFCNVECVLRHLSSWKSCSHLPLCGEQYMPALNERSRYEAKSTVLKTMALIVLRPFSLVSQVSDSMTCVQKRFLCDVRES